MMNTVLAPLQHPRCSRRHQRHGTRRRDPAGAEDGRGGGTRLGRSECRPGGGGGTVSLPLLLEIGTEEIPDWMIPNALESLRLLFEKLEIPHESVAMDATPRRLVLRVL